MRKKSIAAILPMVILLAIPLAMRPRGIAEETDGEAAELIVLTPHAEPVKAEFAGAFDEYYFRKYGRHVKIEFRSVGGTADIVRYIADRFEAEFRRLYQSQGLQPKWQDYFGGIFANPGIDPENHPDKLERHIRRSFLESNTGIGVDIFWGGGSYDHRRHALRGFAADGGAAGRHPEYFAPEVIPQEFAGELIYDPQGRYYGVCLASFGICFNPDRIRDLPSAAVPSRWSDLGDPAFFNSIVVSDPAKSGSANKCFESIIQQTMAEAGGLPEGWANGMNLIKRIIANSRAVTDSAGKVTRDIAAGDAAAGMAIDTYGLSSSEWSGRLWDGKPRIHYVPPKGGTAISADPVQILRGAPNRKTAEEFVDFLLSADGQKLWNYRVGTPGGPRKYSLRRPPVRKDMYRAEHLQYFADPGYNPYEAGAGFTYRPQWTSPYFNLIRTLIKCIALDVQPELAAAWRAITEAGGPEKVPEAMEEFNKLPFSYDEAGAAAALLRVSGSHTVLDVAAICRRWSANAAAHYRRAAELARQHTGERQ